MVLTHVLPPRILDVPLEFDTERPVVPKAVQPTVDLARLEQESSSLAQRHQFFHLHVGQWGWG